MLARRGHLLLLSDAFKNQREARTLLSTTPTCYKNEFLRARQDKYSRYLDFHQITANSLTFKDF